MLYHVAIIIIYSNNYTVLNTDILENESGL